LRNLFYDKAPLHDGAVIIRDNRIYSAGCLLPLSINSDIIKDLGTRHRAAIGASENSDCVAVVVSEETGIVSFVKNGVIMRNMTAEALKSLLEDCLLEKVAEQGSKKKNSITRFFGKRGSHEKKDQ
jgi:diadenylate cyclase